MDLAFVLFKWSLLYCVLNLIVQLKEISKSSVQEVFTFLHDQRRVLISFCGVCSCALELQCFSHDAASSSRSLRCLRIILRNLEIRTAMSSCFYSGAVWGCFK
jgi:hypothetical protein